jgi:hypothetical protein
MSAGERDMSDTEIWGPCGHKWLSFACDAAGALDDEMEAGAVEVQAAVCAACSEELGDHLEVAGLIYEAFDVGRTGRRRPPSGHGSVTVHTDGYPPAWTSLTGSPLSSPRG